METNCYLKKWDRLYFSIATIQEYNQQLTVFFSAHSDTAPLTFTLVMSLSSNIGY